MTKINYHNKRFQVKGNSENGEVDELLIFKYMQKNNVLTCTYSGGQIVEGHILGLVRSDGSLEFSYHQINAKGEIRTGICQSKPEIMENGLLRLHESWKWTSGDGSSGESILEEI